MSNKTGLDMDTYLPTEIWNDLVERLAGQHDPEAPGWNRRDEVVAALMDADVWPAEIASGEKS